MKWPEAIAKIVRDIAEGIVLLGLILLVAQCSCNCMY